MAKGFPAIAIIGPRQSGKTTLVKKVFPEKPYVLLEDPETRAFANEDPRAFLAQFPEGVIIDEAQKVPQLFSYLQGILDLANEPGMFILTGSQNFLLMEKITQSLAGRIAILKLLPFCISELENEKIGFSKYEDYLFNGMYPRLYDMKIKPRDFYASYVQTYLERDLRQLKNIHDLSAFQTFLKMCAHRVGQLINLSALANDCGITHNTAKAWISILQSSFLVVLLHTHHKNFNKRLVKMPKLYFIDTGIRNVVFNQFQDLNIRADNGQLAENFVFSELAKSVDLNNLWFYRTTSGTEIDFLYNIGTSVIPIEVKYSESKQRSIPRAFSTVFQKLDIKKALVLTKNYLNRREQSNISVIFQPIFDIPFEEILEK